MPNGCTVPMVWYTRRCAEGEVQRQVRVTLRCLDSVMCPGLVTVLLRDFRSSVGCGTKGSS